MEPVYRVEYDELISERIMSVLNAYRPILRASMESGSWAWRSRLLAELEDKIKKEMYPPLYWSCLYSGRNAAEAMGIALLPIGWKGEELPEEWDLDEYYTALRVNKVLHEASKAESKAAIERYVPKFMDGTRKALEELFVAWKARNKKRVEWPVHDKIKKEIEAKGKKKLTYAQQWRAAFGKPRADWLAVTSNTKAGTKGVEAGVDVAESEARTTTVRKRRKVWRTRQDELVCFICGPLDGISAEEYSQADAFAGDIWGRSEKEIMRTYRDLFPGGGSKYETLIKRIEESLDEIKKGPPAHINCRCYVGYVTVEGKELIGGEKSDDTAIFDDSEEKEEDKPERAEPKVIKKRKTRAKKPRKRSAMRPSRKKKR